MSAEGRQEVIPRFTSTFSNPSPRLYFYHIVDPRELTLQVHLLGTNLSQTFRHGVTTQLLPRVDVARALERKTAGFVALVQANNGERIPLVWAESGHGSGAHGDILDATPSVLPNRVWTRRVIQVGVMLGIRMSTPFDKFRTYRRSPEEDKTGIFLGSHVEVKLAVYGIYLLLREFGIVQRFRQVTRSRLGRLRDAKWEGGGGALALELYVSRKNCVKCGIMVRRLQEVTGVSISLRCQERLAKKTYKSPTASYGGPKINLLDPDQARESEVIEATDADQSQPLPDVGDRPQPSINLASRAGSGSSSAIEPFIGGVAYCVGEMDVSPAAANVADVDVAKRLWHARSQSSTNALASINKPLPPTPELQPPERSAWNEHWFRA